MAVIGRLCVDALERRGIHEAELRRLAVEEMISQISTRFVAVGPDAAETSMAWALQRMGEMLGGDRVHLFVDTALPSCERSASTIGRDEESYNSPPIGGHIRVALEWCATGIASVEEIIGADAAGPGGRLLEAYRLSGAANAIRVDDLAREAAAERHFWQALGVRSVLSVPLRMEQTLIGLLGCQTLRTERIWTEEDIRLVRRVGEILLNLLVRTQAVRRLLETQAELDRRVAEQMAELVEPNTRLRGEVAEREQAQRAARRGKWEKQLILDHVPAHVAYHDMDMRFVWCNRTQCEWVGRIREELIGRTCYRREVTDAVTRALQERAPQMREQAAWRVLGEIVTLWGRPQPAPHGPATRLRHPGTLPQLSCAWTANGGW